MRNLNFNSRGLSSVIESVLVISIAVLSVAILASLILPTLDLSPQTACTDLTLNTPIEIQDVCYNVQTGDLEVITQRSLNSQQIDSLEFSISSNAGSKNFACSNSCGSCQILASGSTKKYFFSISAPSSITINANGCAIVGQSLENIKNC